MAAPADCGAPNSASPGARGWASLEGRTIAAQLDADAWTRRPVWEGSRGSEYASFAPRRVVASRGDLPGPRF